MTIIPLGKAINAGLNWSDEDDTTLLYLHAQDYPIEAIAATLRRPPLEIEERIEFLEKQLPNRDDVPR